MPTNILTLGGFGTGQLVYQVTNYASVQDAIDQVPDNATIFFPPNEYIPPDANGWIIDKPITILGAGNNDNDSDVCTVFRPYNSDAVGGAPNSRVFKVAARVQRVRFKNFIIYPENVPTSDGTGDGIWFDCSTQQNYHYVEDVQIWYMGRDAIRADGGTFNECSFQRVSLHFNRGKGLYCSAIADMTLIDVHAGNNNNIGIDLRGGGVVGNRVVFARNSLGASGSAQMYLEGCHGFVLNSPDFEEFEVATIKRALWLSNCRGGTINSLRTFNPTEVTNTIGIYADSGCRGIFVNGGTAANVHYFVQVAAGATNRGWVVQCPGPHTITATCPALISLQPIRAPRQVPVAGISNSRR